MIYIGGQHKIILFFSNSYFSFLGYSSTKPPAYLFAVTSKSLAMTGVS